MDDGSFASEGKREKKQEKKIFNRDMVWVYLD